jgi:Immunity protein family (Imm11)
LTRGMRFCEFTSDTYGPTPRNRWQIDIESTLPSGEWWDVWAYSIGNPAQPPPYPFRISHEGPRSDVNITCFGTFVVSKSVANVVDAVADSEVQLIPVTIGGDTDEWFILNILSVVECIDYQRSQIPSYYPDDFEDASRAGKPRGILRLVIDPERVGDHQIFRVKDWRVAVVVSEKIRAALDQSWAIGLRFEPVTS